MKLWTIQYPEVYEELLKKGVFSVDEEYVDEDFKKKYDWLIEQMVVRVGLAPKNAKYPIWAYARFAGVDNKRPDLRRAAYGKRGEQLVLLELEIPEDRICLTDMSGWDHVLLNSPYYPNLSEDEWDKKRKWFDALPIQEKENELTKTWELLFNIVPYDPSDKVCCRCQYVQATFWELRIEDVCSVKHFLAK